MFRNLRIFLAAALALTALGAIAAGAHAADEFHCSVSPCRGTLATDGTGKEAHHVWVIENEATTEAVSFTCESLRGDLEFSGKAASTVRVTGITIDNCSVNGSAGVVADRNGCEYIFSGIGGRTDEAEVTVECPTGKRVEITYNGCVLTITGGFSSKGVGYTTKGTTPNREITVTVNHATVPASHVSFDGTKAQCLFNPAQNVIITYITGNTLITGETTAGVMADTWYE